MARRSHVPKFGNWDKDNVPYTAYFENARKEKVGGVMINPNDPQQNPDALMYGDSDTQQLDLSFGHPPPPRPPIHVHRHAHARRKSTNTSESRSGSEKSNSDYSLSQQAASRREKSDGKKAYAAAVDEGKHHHRTASIPKFGAWDETDPKSGDGFTVIFNRVREEKQISSATFPSLPPPVPPYPFSNQTNQSCLSKFCCCLFSCGKQVE